MLDPATRLRRRIGRFRSPGHVTVGLPPKVLETLSQYSTYRTPYRWLRPERPVNRSAAPSGCGTCFTGPLT